MRVYAFALASLLVRDCGVGVGPGGGVVEGTWGGMNAGLIATDTTAHVHIGCTLGDTKSGIVPGPDGRFDVSGLYNITAYPVYRGPDHPARFTGRVSGRYLTLTVSLTDTAVTLGPVTLKYGAPPQLGPCPICRIPKARRPMP